MAQMADPRDSAQPQYPPPDNPNSAYYNQQSPQRAAHRDDRNPYPPPPPPDQARGQYPSPDPRAPYPPPGQWPGQQHSAYPPPPPHPHYPDPQHAAYSYPPPPRHDVGQPPQPMQPDAYRLPPPYVPPYYAAPHYAAPPAPAPRQRTAIACKYCRKRKIRCSGYENSPDGRCQNCIRFNQQCLFHPVSSQAAFVPASAVYGPNASRAPVAGQPDGRPAQNGHNYPREGEQPMQLYGAHGQPLGPAGPHGQPPYGYPPHAPQGYGHPGYPYPPGAYGPPPPAGQYDPQGQAPPAHDDRVSLKRPPPDDDPHNENSHTSQSPHPNARPRHESYTSHASTSSGYNYPEPTSMSPTSPATSTMSYQSYPPPPPAYTNGNQPQKGNVSPPAAGLTPQSAHSYNSPHHRDDGRTPPPNQPGSAGSSANSRSGMKVHEMLGNPNPHGAHSEQRARNDNEMLSKLDGKK